MATSSPRCTRLRAIVSAAWALTVFAFLAIATPARAQAVRPHTKPIADSVVRRAVVEQYPAALTGDLGAEPFVWILADSSDRVLLSATGREALRRDGAGRDWIDWESAARMLPGMPRSARPGDLLGLSRVTLGADSASVVWVRINAGLPDR